MGGRWRRGVARPALRRPRYALSSALRPFFGACPQLLTRCSAPCCACRGAGRMCWMLLCPTSRSLTGRRQRQHRPRRQPCRRLPPAVATAEPPPRLRYLLRPRRCSAATKCRLRWLSGWWWLSAMRGCANWSKRCLAAAAAPAAPAAPAAAAVPARLREPSPRTAAASPATGSGLLLGRGPPRSPEALHAASAAPAWATACLAAASGWWWAWIASGCRTAAATPTRPSACCRQASTRLCACLPLPCCCRITTCRPGLP